MRLRTRPNHAMQRTRPARSGCNSRVSRAVSLSLVVRCYTRTSKLLLLRCLSAPRSTRRRTFAASQATVPFPFPQTRLLWGLTAKTACRSSWFTTMVGHSGTTRSGRLTLSSRRKELVGKSSNQPRPRSVFLSISAPVAQRFSTSHSRWLRTTHSWSFTLQTRSRR
jgi:hypothetical protein